MTITATADRRRGPQPAPETSIDGRRHAPTLAALVGLLERYLNDFQRQRSRLGETAVAVITPALDLWRRELAAGTRTAFTFDPVWRAACEEQSARNYVAAGLPSLAEVASREAQQIIRRAARTQAADEHVI